jgi:hypothetical protein
MQYNYETIKQIAKDTGRRVSDLIALAPANDPFYTGTPGERTLAEWFADFYHSRYDPGTKVHVRRCHYKILSLGLPLPSGKPYENTEECWDTLLLATKAARYLGLVDAGMFEDKKNAAPISYGNGYQYDPEIRVNDYLYSSDLQVPEFPDLPRYSVDNYRNAQPYHLELWCEKTTMNDILLPLCERYGMTLQTGAGELSITAAKVLAQRIEQIGKPARILYISDYDPAGQSMPVAVSRKLEYFARNEQLDIDVRLFPVVLTANQVAQYQLPRTPIKESERRKESFEARHGQGATELDALEALRPGELQRILRRYIERYYDTTLDNRTRQAREALEDDLSEIRREVLARHAQEIQATRQELQRITDDFGPRMDAYGQHLRELWQAIAEDMENSAPPLADYPMPEPRPAEELGEGLYNSERDYLEQIDEYKRFQGK